MSRHRTSMGTITVVTCTWKVLLACGFNASHILHLQYHYLFHVYALLMHCLLRKVFPNKTSSGRSVTTVETKLGGLQMLPWVGNWDSFLVASMTLELSVSLSFFCLILYIATILWSIVSFEAFITPLIFSQLQAVRRSLCLSALTLNSGTALSLSSISYNSVELIFNKLQLCPSKVLKELGMFPL